jgi:hypothetical protein
MHSDTARLQNGAAFEFEAAQGFDQLGDLQKDIAELFAETAVGQVRDHAAPLARSM